MIEILTMLAITSAALSTIVVIDNAVRELQCSDRLYREFWVRWRNRFERIIFPFVGINRSCSIADQIMNLVLSKPKWPLNPDRPPFVFPTHA